MSFVCSVPGVIYLSPEIQETLPYTLVKLVPYKSYSRKNIGYLYAIQVTTLLDVFRFKHFQMTSHNFFPKVGCD